MPVKEPGPTVTANRSTAASVVLPFGRDLAQHGHERLRMPAASLDAPVGGHLALGPERGRAGRRRRIEPE